MRGEEQHPHSLRPHVLQSKPNEEEVRECARGDRKLEESRGGRPQARK